MQRNLKCIVASVLLLLLVSLVTACNDTSPTNDTSNTDNQAEVSISSQAMQVTEDNDTVTAGTTEYRGFIVDNILHSKDYGDIHYNVYIPNKYDGSKPCALYLTLLGYQGLYFQSVAENLKTEEFAFEAQNYNSEMIIVAPHLEDWGGTPANQTIALTEYFLNHYNIDKSKVYANGYSGGGETMSIVMGKRADLFTAYLHCSSQWDGEYETIVNNKIPVYFVVGESDEYYGPQPSKDAYSELYDLYERQGLTDSEINKLLVLDIKDKNYFSNGGIQYQHVGGKLFVQDEEIMGWLLTDKQF